MRSSTSTTPSPPAPFEASCRLDDGAWLCVLASGSMGNCSVFATVRGSVVRLCLIDLGLSPRKTFKLLSELGLRPDQIDHAILTHLDSDHFRPTWLTCMPRHAKIRLHARHEMALRRSHAGRLFTQGQDGDDRLVPFDGPFDLDTGVRVHPFLMSHDELGVSTLRFDLSGSVGGGGRFAFATDLGHVTPALIDHLKADLGNGPGLDVLAIESNYCRAMQLDSDRPEALKNRIMGGSGHLSNDQALEAISAVQPREHVVFLHLSQECNNPAIVASMHDGADYARTISNQFLPTRWIRLSREACQPRPRHTEADSSVGVLANHL